MAITIHIPPKHLSYFTLFVRGNITEKVTLPKEGTLIETEGVCIVYYTYSKHRRAYIICDTLKTHCFSSFYLPNIREKIHILYQARGRKIDLMRQAIYNLEQMSNKAVYSLPPIFWQKFSCLLDNYNGYKSAAIKSNLIQLYNFYRDKIW